MKNLDIIATYSGLEACDYYEITVEDKPFAGGGFGEIFHIVSLDGNTPKRSLVLKLFRPNNNGGEMRCWNATLALCDKVFYNVLSYEKNGMKFLEEFPALSALPLYALTIKLDGIERRGYVMYNLSDMGLIGFDKIIDSDDDESVYWDEFEEHDITWRLTAAYHLARGFNMLEKMNFLHADISSDNIFVSRTEPLAVIIDYDSGAVINSAEDNPTTFGKMQAWLAPEILFQLKRGETGKKVLVDVNIYSDRWAVTHAITQLLTTLQAFYLTDMSEKTLSKYKNDYTWPTIDTDDSIFMEGNEEAYKYFIERWRDNLPELIKHELSYTFNNGIFNPACRTSYSRWEFILRSLIQNKAPSPLPTPPPNPRPVTQPVVPENPEAAKKELIQFMDVLITDIINGNETIGENQYFIGKRAHRAGVDEGKLIAELKDFVDMFQTLKKKKKNASTFDLKNLRLQGSLAFISSDKVDSLIKKHIK